ncbi:MAG TPA: bifunctional phosphopantothenoylcysteine decarboxylase/phosphopantothenate--cysteine ligase CoaBC [Flavobacteriales bacterium]|nr:bifunctional phosphopantothenoylcysteine decarboxylase/phosphopantothenate--cysteine ligase CoaBC [Flavobacteriales bacterium]
MVRGRKILLGVTGSISAYKAVYLVRLLVQEGAQVKVVMTPSATSFVSPVTFATLSKNPVLVDLLKNEKTGEWVNHVELGAWADIFVIAPASANTLAKMVYGMADNLLLTAWLSAKCPVMVAPAMDHDMYHHFSTQNNLDALSQKGVTIIDPGKGELASGLIGDGRLAEPEEIFQKISAFFLHNSFHGKFIGKNVLITAGPTYEELDPVRFIGNHSTGKMGYTLANALANAGANVTLVSGPSQLEQPPHVKFEKVVSANDMFTAVQKQFSGTDIVIMAAAVADYRPVKRADQKIKKAVDSITLELEKTTDILAELGKTKKNQFLVGFALETTNELEHARQKLKTKNLDMVVLNSLRDKGAGFGYDTNKISIIGKDNKIASFELTTKAQTANHILNAIAQNI